MNYKQLCFSSLFAFSYLFSESNQELAQAKKNEDTSNKIVPIEQIQQELTAEENEFETARKMFNPWYAGPLITGSAHTLAPGSVNIQPYLYVIDNYAAFNKSRHSESITTLMVVNPTVTVQTGILSWWDVTLGLQGFYKKREGVQAGDIGDTSLTLGIELVNETEYIPAMKLALSESFPTGLYRNFKPHKILVESTGSGSFMTGIGLNFGKVLWWWVTHPMNLRMAFKYSIPSDVKVEGFNTYGGGFDTKGHVKPGGIFAANFGYEISLSQKFVFAVDLCYEYDKKSTFRGFRGVTSSGDSAEVGFPMSDVLSLAPAIEYNFNSDLALVGGAWFSVYGKNAFNFAAGVITFTATF
jgi:hypothetical protein